MHVGRGGSFCFDSVQYKFMTVPPPDIKQNTRAVPRIYWQASKKTPKHQQFVSNGKSGQLWRLRPCIVSSGNNAHRSIKGSIYPRHPSASLMASGSALWTADVTNRCRMLLKIYLRWRCCRLQANPLILTLWKIQTQGKRVSSYHHKKLSISFRFRIYYGTWQLYFVLLVLLTTQVPGVSMSLPVLPAYDWETSLVQCRLIFCSGMNCRVFEIIWIFLSVEVMTQLLKTSIG